MSQFEFYTAPRIVFGPGTLERTPELLPGSVSKVLLVVGGQSAEDSGLLSRLQQMLPVGTVARCRREPRVEDVDAAVAEGKAAKCDAVVAVGGGSVLDCGKAASGMMTNPGSLLDYLEGVGKGLSIQIPPAPLIAIPTTAGTGSEVTKNAVISGPGFKKSVRSPLLIPRVALVDSELTHSMSPEVTASCGMDALTQLIESYLSRNASPFTDGLCLEGIAAAAKSLSVAYQRPDDAGARDDMALASLLGGVCLANAGLGAVHGFASPLGALSEEHPIPHGVACAALLPQVVEANLEASRGTEVAQRLETRVASVGRILARDPTAGEQQAIEAGLKAMFALQRDLRIPRLSELGVTEQDLEPLVRGSRGSSMRYNPVDLTDAQLEAILRAGL